MVEEGFPADVVGEVPETAPAEGFRHAHLEEARAGGGGAHLADQGDQLIGETAVLPVQPTRVGFDSVRSMGDWPAARIAASTRVSASYNFV